MRCVKKGLFITFEGGEASGKTTQIERLARWLKRRGRPLLVTREPGGTPLADRIRHHLLHAGKTDLTPTTELFLYEVARRDHVIEVIGPALEEGATVLCDRFADATVAYQGFGRNLPLEVIDRLNSVATGGIRPDVTFLFDLPVVESRRRLEKRGKRPDRLEREEERFHEKVREGYLRLAEREKRRFKVIDGKLPRDRIAYEIRRTVEKLFQGRKRTPAGVSTGRSRRQR